MAGVLGRDQRNSGRRIVNFENWFEIATKNIAESELPKIRNELEAHVFDAINVHQQTGISTLEAEEKAVLELGDPKIAARGFQREYLTREQVRRFMPEPAKHIWVKMMICMAFSGLVLLALWDVKIRYPTLLHAFTLYFGGTSIFLWVAMLFDSIQRRLLQRYCAIPGVASLIAVEYLTLAFSILVWFFYIPEPFKIPLWACLAMMTFLVGGMTCVEIPLLRKLRA
jgi:uncharacterized membrane protein